MEGGGATGEVEDGGAEEVVVAAGVGVVEEQDVTRTKANNTRHTIPNLPWNNFSMLCSLLNSLYFVASNLLLPNPTRKLYKWLHVFSFCTVHIASTVKYAR